MHIQEIVVYGRTPDEIQSKYAKTLSELESIINGINIEDIQSYTPRRNAHFAEGEFNVFKLKQYFEEQLDEAQWKESKSYVENSGERKFYMRILGHLKDKTSCAFASHRELFNRWLYTLTPIAFKNDLIDIPFIIIPAKSIHVASNRSNMGMREEFERVLGELKALEPLSHSFPFVIIGISLEKAEITWTELESDKGVSESKVVINRSIEFPPEFRQAGLGILNYFSEIVREKYPDSGAKIRIEQEGNNVRMIVEAEDGSRDIIEKALEEYELVVKGKASPESIFDNKAKVLELKNELRIAENRIASQRDIIDYQREDVRELKQLFSQSLTNKQAPINLTVSPCITVSSHQSNTLNNCIEVGDVLDDIQSLMDRGSDPETSKVLNDLYESVENINQKSEPEQIQSSGALRKFKKFLDEATKSGTKVNDFISQLGDGFETLKCLAGKYNSIAEWCGAPQVPKSLL